MPAIIDSLIEDHRNMEKLLRLLEQELVVFDAAERPDFDVLAGIVEYFRSYPLQVHHPKEDLLARQLAARDPARADAIIGIEAEHSQAERRLDVFARLVEGVLNDQELSRQALDLAATEFVAHERRHIEIEERELFPAARAILSGEDWTQLDAKLDDARDPLFDRKIERRYAALAARLARWEEEDRATRGGSGKGLLST
jgi:hemerythrin-like domain-containing protein